MATDADGSGASRNEQWVAAHMTPGQTAESLLDCFKRAVRQELELLGVECVEQA